MTLPARVEAVPEAASDLYPKVYCADDTHPLQNWVAEGTDGHFYRVPSEPGGWKRRYTYDGPIETLKRFGPEKARAIVTFAGGRNGRHDERDGVSIAESSGAGTQQTPVWRAGQGEAYTAD